MKLLWLTVAPLDQPGFRSTQFGMAIALEKLGWQIHLMGKTSRPQPFDGYEGFQGNVTLIKRSGRFMTELRHHALIWKTLLTEKPDIVIFEPPQLRLIVVPAGLSLIGLLKAKFILDVRTPLVEEALRSLLESLNYWLAMKFARWVLPGVTVITEGLRRDLLKLLGRKIPLFVWGSGVDTDLFNPDKVLNRSQLKLNIEGKFVFLHHGSLSMQKGIQVLVKAMKPIVELYPHAVLIILGDGPAKDELKGMVRSLGLDGSVIFLDSVPNHDVPAQIAMADVGVIPIPADRHWQVSSPLKLFEYMAMRLPVIVSDIEAHRSILGNSPFAIYVDEVSQESLYEAMKLAVEKIEELKSYAQESRAITIAEHSWSRRAAGLSDFLAGILIYKKAEEINHV